MLSKLLAFILLFSFIIFNALADIPVNDATNAAASRMENGSIVYYESLHEAIIAVPANDSRFDLSSPDEITLLADITLNSPIDVEDGQHIRLLAGGDNRTIRRGSDFLDFPVIWVKGDNSSLHLGLSYLNEAAAEYELIIDGGFASTPPIEANAVLVAVNGLGAQLIMHDGVYLQNNLNKSASSIDPFVQHGGGVLIRTRDDLSHNPSRFIMKGGVIRGNVNTVLNAPAYGGGVYISGFGTFIMEGGEISGNIAQRAGGGVFIYGTGSFVKSGGTISSNMAMDGIGTSRIYGHAIVTGIIETSFFRYRNDTVHEHDNLSYSGSPDGRGVYGEDERWSSPGQASNHYVLLVILFIVLLLFSGFIFYRKTKKKKDINPLPASIMIPPEVKLSIREREVFNLFIEGKTAKQTALELGLTISSINYYSESLYRKLGIQSRTELLVKYRG